MKLHCNIEVRNRLLPLAFKRKLQRCLLTIGRGSIKNDLYIFVQTLQNKQGTKYKINGNIEQVFTKFVNDGKATIRLIEPCHDLIIQSNAIQLRSFLHILKLGLSKKVDLHVPTILNLKPKNMSSTLNIKVVVKKNSEYPTLEGFPKTTEELVLNGLDRKSFDRQILNLRNLRILNLSDNQLVFLPKELGCLPHLQELYLSQNRLGKSIQSKWSWLDQAAIRKSLCLLDLRNNLLTELPKQIGKLNILVNLKVSQNVLTCLPHNIGTLQKLKYLDLSKNHLLHLPGSMRNLRLSFLDISDNPFSNNRNYYTNNMKVLSLVECSARSFLKSRIMYDSHLIPFTLIKYLDEAKYCCVCGSACFNCYIRRSMQFDLKNIADEIKLTLDRVSTFDCYFCSVKCNRDYFRIL